MDHKSQENFCSFFFFLICGGAWHKTSRNISCLNVSLLWIETIGLCLFWAALPEAWPFEHVPQKMCIFPFPQGLLFGCTIFVSCLSYQNVFWKSHRPVSWMDTDQQWPHWNMSLILWLDPMYLLCWAFLETDLGQQLRCVEGIKSNIDCPEGTCSVFSLLCC